jgi:hypothetical protein
LRAGTDDSTVPEYAFELALCARLERERDGVVARQLGGGVDAPGKRVLDVVHVEPGPDFERRAAITDETIPDAAIRGDAGPGRARPWRDCFPDDLHEEAARRIADAAVDQGFFERERRGGREYLRQTTRYPGDWFGDVLAVENKPDLDAPGALERQLQADVSLALADRVVLATESHVTGAHRNRIPDAVGIWRYDPDTDDLRVLREPTRLDVDAPGVERLTDRPGRTDVAVVDPAEIQAARRRLAERAYGKGWRTFDLPGCEHLAPDPGTEHAPNPDARDHDPRPAAAATATLPYCAFHERVVDPARVCNPDCPGYDPAEPPAVDLDAERDARSDWRRDPDGLATRQSGLDAFQ